MPEFLPAPVRRPWCLRLAVGLVLFGAGLNLLYLYHHCPFDLSGDEAHYWLWSQNLDYGYYSKPPGIACVIAAAEWMGRAIGLDGNGSGAALMPVIRTPAVLFACLSGMLSLFLARRMFRDDRAALAVTLLSAAVPMFAIGSLLITIDSPMYLCWAATVFCLWRAVESSAQSEASSTGKKIGWLYAAGLACAMGMLFKPVLIAIPLCAAIAAWLDPAVRRAYKTWHSLGAAALVILSQAPVVVWNANHGWVTFRHIGAQGGITRLPAHFNMPRSVGEYLGGQIAGLGGLMFLLLVAAVVVAIRTRRRERATGMAEAVAAEGGRRDLGGTQRPWAFLLAFSLPLWAFYFLLSFWKGTEINWPAASYFAAMILAGGVVAQRFNSDCEQSRRRWRGWATATVVWGVIVTSLALNLQRFYPVAAAKLRPLLGSPAYATSAWNPRRWDLALKKLRGFQEEADLVDAAREKMRAGAPEPLLVTGRYDTSSSLTFYMPNHPFVYCIMSSLDRGNQYDLWPGPNQQLPDGRLKFAGQAALIVGTFSEAEVGRVLRPAFERLEGPEYLPLWYQGILVREIAVYRGYGFRGFPGARTGNY